MKLTHLSSNYIYAILLVFTFILYGNTLNHGFVLDDAIAITENSFVKKGLSGIPDLLKNESMVGFYGTQKSLVSGGRYRPLSYVFFAVIYEFFGENNKAFHFFAVLLYGISCLLLYKLLILLFKERFSDSTSVFALVCCLVYLVHPTHTEVVANIKGLDETMALIGLLGSWLFLIQYIANKKIINLLLLGITFFLSLLSKETAITFLVILPLSIYFFKQYSKKELIIAVGALVAVSAIWYIIRSEIVGGFSINSVADNLMNDPFLEASNSEKYATIFCTLWKYLQLLVFPHPLTFDYYPKHIPLVGFNNPIVILSILTYISLAIISIWGLLKKNIYAFGIIVYLAALSISSNLVFSIGVFMNERFLFLPSLGFSITLAYFFVFQTKSLIKSTQLSQQLSTVIVLVLIGLFSLKTIDRNNDWKSNLTLATTDAITSTNGAKSQTMAGGLLLEEAQKTSNPIERKQLLNRSIQHLEQATRIYPNYIDPKLLLGNAYWESSKTAEPALSQYYSILAINPSHADANNNIQIVIGQLSSPQEKIAQWDRYLPYANNAGKVHLEMGNIYGQQLNNLPKAILSLRKANQLLPNNIDVLINLSTAYALNKSFEESIQLLEKAVKQYPNKEQFWINLGLAYAEVGRNEESKIAFDKALTINPQLNRGLFPN